MAYVQRYIEPLLEDVLANQSLAILEGARAVGKTRLLYALQERGVLRTVQSLTSPEIRNAAEADVGGWLRSLPTPFAIDEAQLIPELPLALKRLLDERQDELSGLLTGSAEIGRQGLGGSDPLARRVQRFRLEPLTEAEIQAENGPWSVVDALIAQVPALNGVASTPTWWKDALWLGGMPSIRLNTTHGARRQRSRRIRSGIDSILTENVLPGERYDLTNAKRVLDYALRKPAEEIKVKPIGDRLGIDPRSVNRYLDVCERRFLTYELPNFLRSSKTSSRVTAKLYPADTSLSAEWLPAQTFDQLNDIERGHLFEAFVVQQLRAHLAWAKHGQAIYHWRDTRKGRTKEVDVVIEASDGSLTAIEVKSSSEPRSQDFNGIRNFKENYPDRFARGFVISPATTPAPFGENLWALPVQALRNAGLWDDPAGIRTSPTHPTTDPSPEYPEKTDMTTTAPSSANNSPANPHTQIFISYAHKDNEGLYEGKMEQFVEDIRDILETEHEWSATIMWDEAFLRWGDDLESRIETELADSALFIPFVSPSYLNSEWCRKEFVQFTDAATRADAPRPSSQSSLVLPMVWTPPKALSDQDSNDPVVQRVRATKYIQAMNARNEPRGSKDYIRVVNEVATALAELLEERSQVPLPAGEDHAPPEDPRDMTEVLASFEELQNTFEENASQFGRAFKNFALGFQQVSASARPAGAASARDLLNWAAQARRTLQQPSEELEIASAKVQRDWERMTRDLTAFVAIGKETGQEIPADQLRSLAEDLEAATGSIPSAELEQIESIAHALPRMSHQLKPVADALHKAVSTLKAVTVSADGWLSSIYRAGDL